ncbi:hypothetical protein LWI29_005706 [Acer saccharum]|uniref:Uncharacterized protein n=1 Tax=Acer saccharum TaxID=4024 RepID=A0AA39SIP1_ACESA|nr:hypothetical protein LWI29_005706 [Acer saccharum]
MSLRLLLILRVTWPLKPVEINAQLRVLLTMLLDSQNGRQGLCNTLSLRMRRVLMNRYSPKLPLLKRLPTRVLLKGQMQWCLPLRKLMNYMSLLLLRPKQSFRPEWPHLRWPWVSQMFLQVILNRLVGQNRLIDQDHRSNLGVLPLAQVLLMKPLPWDQMKPMKEPYLSLIFRLPRNKVSREIKRLREQASILAAEKLSAEESYAQHLAHLRESADAHLEAKRLAEEAKEKAERKALGLCNQLSSRELIFDNLKAVLEAEAVDHFKRSPAYDALLLREF